jgi:5-aminolevulinate synthase
VLAYQGDWCAGKQVWCYHFNDEVHEGFCGYLVSLAALVNIIQSYAAVFILHSSHPVSSLVHTHLPKSHLGDCLLQHLDARTIKPRFAKMDIPVVPNPPMVPVLVGDAELAKKASNWLLLKHGIYVQSIYYLTVLWDMEH